MKISITVSEETARAWQYFLRKKRGSKAELPHLIKLEIYTIVSQEAEKELKESEAKV